jgi:hypothetical protein
VVAAYRPDQAELAHQPLDGAPGDLHALLAQRQPDLPRPVHLLVLLVHADDLLFEFGVAHRPGRRRPALRGIIGGRGELQDFTDRLDPGRIPVCVDEGDYLGGRGSSSRAKKAAAAFRISFARVSSRISRSSSAIRCASAVEVPGLWPPSISACHPGAQRFLADPELLGDSCDRTGPLAGILAYFEDHPDGAREARPGNGWGLT